MGRFFVNYGQFFDDATDFKFTPGSVCSPLFYLSNYLNATGTNDERIISSGKFSSENNIDISATRRNSTTNLFDLNLIIKRMKLNCDAFAVKHNHEPLCIGTEIRKT